MIIIINNGNNNAYHTGMICTERKKQNAGLYGMLRISMQSTHIHTYIHTYINNRVLRIQLHLYELNAGEGGNFMSTSSLGDRI